MQIIEYNILYEHIMIYEIMEIQNAYMYVTAFILWLLLSECQLEITKKYHLLFE